MYCHICGKELPDQAKTCPECGIAVPEIRENRKLQIATTSQKMATQQMQNKETKHKQKEMVCPQCGADNLQIINEVNTDTTTSGSGFSASKGCCGYIMFGPVGLLCGACNRGPKTTTTTTNTTYFVCSKCGKKFRKPAELREEAEKEENYAKAAAIALPIAAVLCIVLGFIMSNRTAWIICISVAVLDVILMFVNRAISNNNADKLYEEADQIEQGMNKYR